MMLIESPKNPRIKELLKLREGKHRRRMNRFLLEGDRELRRAIDSGIEICEIYTCPQFLKEEGQEAIALSTLEPVQVSAAVFEKIALREMSGGLVATAIPKFHDLSILDNVDKPFVLVVESVEKPGNLGAILRTADGSGADLVVVLDEKADVYNPNSIRASLGGVFSTPVARSSAEELLKYCQKNQIQLVAASPDASQRYHEVDMNQASAIVLGSEAFGLSDFWEGAANLVSIPMLGVCDSLNVSVSAAVLAYDLRRQRSN